MHQKCYKMTKMVKKVRKNKNAKSYEIIYNIGKNRLSDICRKTFTIKCEKCLMKTKLNI